MDTIKKGLLGLLFSLCLFCSLAQSTSVTCPAPTTFNPDYDTYADWQWDCTYYIDYVYVPDFPDAWRPAWYHGSDWYYGSLWSGYVPSGYWQPYVASSCYWVLSGIYDMVESQVDLPPYTEFKATWHYSNGDTYTHPLSFGYWDSASPHIISDISGYLDGPTITNITASQPYDVSLVSQTTATIPSNRSRTKLGVGETVSLSVSPTPSCGVTWSLSGNGSLSSTSGNSITFTAHERASNPTVTATINGTPLSVTYNVVEPASESASKTSEDSYPSGMQGAGMHLLITVSPTDVSFTNVEMQEVAGPASNITGYFSSYSPSFLAHNPPSGWIQLNDGNIWGDVAELSGQNPPWWAGGFQWTIPVRWRVVGSTNASTLPDRTQTFSIQNSSGTTTITKMGQSVTRTP